MLGNVVLFFLIYKFLWSRKRRRMAKNLTGPWKNPKTVPNRATNIVSYALFIFGVFVILLGVNAYMPMSIRMLTPFTMLFGCIAWYQFCVRIPCLPIGKKNADMGFYNPNKNMM